jgi:PBSX family phage terminase large subunit
MYNEPFSPRQTEFILKSQAKFNLAHGSVRSGKTVGVLFRFMQAAHECPGDQIWMIGHTHSSIYHNCIRLLLDEKSRQFGIFAPFCSWAKGDRMLYFGTKRIYCLGASDESAIGPIQGKTFDLCYCNEMTLYPENVIQMISTRISMPHSKLFADMNPVQPSHICKKWIDFSEKGDPEYYSLHFTVEDNPYLPESHKKTMQQTLTGLFFRRNYLGEWCLAEGAIFDFFDKTIHVTPRPRGNTLFWIAGIDYGASNPFACVLIRVSELPEGKQLWVEKEYYYDPKKTRVKTNSELARDLVSFFGDYTIRAVYLDPSAASFKAELSRNKIHAVETNNEVKDGILTLIDALKEGTLEIGQNCPNLIREIEGYVWDPKASERGEDKPLKQNDHAVDSLRYAVKSFMGNRSSFKYTEEEKRGFVNPSLSGKKDQGIDWGHGWQRF